MAFELNDQALFDVFGDESSNREIVSYAAVMVPSVLVAEVEKRLAEAKSNAGASPTARIHCKILLHGDKRARSNWKHLTQHDAFSFLERVTDSVGQTGARAWIGYLESHSVPKRMYFEDDKRKVIEQKITDLHQVHFAYQTAMAPVMDILPHTHTRGWMDPNATKLKLISQNRQFRLAQGFFPANHNNLRFEPIEIGKSKPALLDVADIVAHCGARALSKAQSAGNEKYEAVLKNIKTGLSYAHFTCDDGAYMKCEANSQAIAEFKEYFRSFLNPH